MLAYVLMPRNVLYVLYVAAYVLISKKLYIKAFKNFSRGFI